MVKNYFLFAYNITKKCINVLHFMNLYILYKIICIALKKCQKNKIEDIKYSVAQPVFYIL